jgi:anti-anti-sigma factor
VEALPDFRIETLESQSATTIKLGGELDSATCGELISRFDRILAAAAPPELVLDLSQVSFIDSSGMRAIILLERSAGERDVRLTILPAPEAVSDLLDLTGLGDRVALAPDSAGRPATEPFVERIELDLPREPIAPARARAELREAFTGRLSDDDRATITLLTSELVTNAVIHPEPGSGGSIGLRIIAYPHRVRVEVSDAGAGFDPSSLAPRPREAGGHGLIVVDGLSSRWGTDHPTPEGAPRFCVWFELDADYDVSGSGASERSVAAADG